MRDKIKKISSNPIFLYLLLYATVLLFLSLFRHASADEAYYLKEVTLLAKLLREGKWFGDYGVGLHGFLFKLPVAFVFALVGKPSVYIATLYTILLSVSSIYLFYIIVRRYFLKQKFAIWATVLFSALFHFIETSISFNRDIPAVLTVLLFIYLFLKDSKGWLIGVSLLLMLDAKEHVFFTVAPLYVTYLIIIFIRDWKEKNRVKNLVEIIKKLFSGYFLSLIWIILMFTTSILPVNMFVASILGFTEIGQDWNKSQFSTEVASKNLMEGAEKEIFKLSEFKFNKKVYFIGKEEMDIFCKCVKYLEIIILYIGKSLYPRTFSFISIPKIIVLPAIAHALSLFVSWWRKKDRKFLLPMILFFNTIVIILRASHGRYLLGVSSFFILFFILFLKDGLKKPVHFRNVLFLTTVFVLSGLLFESTFIIQKIILELSLLVLFWMIWILRKKKVSIVDFSKNIFIFALIIGMFSTSLMFSLKIGQISSFIRYGYNREVREISENFKPEEKIWINDFGSGELIDVYRENYFNEPEWNWRLAWWIPKRDLLKIHSSNNTFSFRIEDIKVFHREVKRDEIDKIALVVSTLEENFPEEKKLRILQSQEWLKLIDKIELKNKNLFIFNVEY